MYRTTGGFSVSLVEFNYYDSRLDASLRTNVISDDGLIINYR